MNDFNMNDTMQKTVDTLAGNADSMSITAYVFCHNVNGERVFIHFKGNCWRDADKFAEASFFLTKEEAKKKQKYAPLCDIAQVTLSIDFNTLI